MKLKRGDIVLADLGQSMTRGHVQNGIRPEEYQAWDFCSHAEEHQLK